MLGGWVAQRTALAWLNSANVLFLQVDQREAALASLSLLVIIHCTWFVLENFLLDYYVR